MCQNHCPYIRSAFLQHFNPNFFAVAKFFCNIIHDKLFQLSSYLTHSGFFLWEFQHSKCKFICGRIIQMSAFRQCTQFFFLVALYPEQKVFPESCFLCRQILFPKLFILFLFLLSVSSLHLFHCFFQNLL